jgi:hypothetical protein
MIYRSASQWLPHRVVTKQGWLYMVDRSKVEIVPIVILYLVDHAPIEG